MKSLKLLFFSLALVLFTVSSCTDNESLLNEIAEPQESLSVKTTLDALSTYLNEDGSINLDRSPAGHIIFDFCFDFVYPITLSYNTGATVTVNGFEELIEVIISSTDDLFIVGIAFPFDVEVFNDETDTIEILTINNEDDFIALIESCDFGGGDVCECTDEYDPVCVEIVAPTGETYVITFGNACIAECEGFSEDEYFVCDGDPTDGGLFDDDCFEFIYPLSIVTEDGLVIEVGSLEELNTTIYASYYFEFIYPIEISFIDSDEIITIEGEAGLFEVLEYCSDRDCECPDVYDPVCVETDEGIITFENACYAECEGFTEVDFIDCDSEGDCLIYDLIVEVGECNDDGTYSLTIDFEYENPGNDFFDVSVYDGDTLVVIGFYELAGLPITIPDFELSGFDFDSLFVNINDNPDCNAGIEWEAPDCTDTCDCPDLIDPVCVMNPTGDVITFDNACLAECEGYTAADFVDCETGGGDCAIFDLTVEVGACNDDGTYSLTINFAYENPGNDFFDVYVRDEVFVGFYELADLPITIPNFELSGLEYDFVSVNINDTPDCFSETEWLAPDCRSCDCPTGGDPVCVEFEGAIITFENACFAECEGFTEADFIVCE